MHKKGYLKNILFSAVTVIAFFSVLEGIQRVRHPTIGYRDAYNSLGFRGPETTVEKAARTGRIVFVGESTTFGVCNDSEHTFPFLTGRMLRERLPGVSVETINAARPARNSDWVAGQIRKTLALKPDLWIVLTAHNDAAMMHAPIYTYEVIDDKVIFRVPWYRKIHDFFLNHSSFYVTLREKIAVILHGDPEFAYLPSREKDAFLDMGFVNARLTNYRSNLKAIIKTANDNGIKIIFLKAPIGDVRRTRFPHYYECYAMVTAELEKATRDEHIPLIDIGRFFNGLKQKEIFADDIHFTDEANTRIASGLVDYLLEHKDLYFSQNT